MNAPHFSSQPYGKIKTGLGIVVFGVLGVLLASPPIFGGIKDIIQDLFFNDLKQYRAPIRACIDRKTASASGARIIGLDYACAIEIGATFYVENPDRAIRLCKAFYPFAAPTRNDKRLQEYEDQLQKTACRLALERRIKNASSTSAVR